MAAAQQASDAAIQSESAPVWKAEDIDHLFDNLSVPDFWMEQSHITHGLMNKIVAEIERRGNGLVQHTLTEILMVLKPQLNINDIPKYFNVKMKLKAKSTNFDDVVPWTESAGNPETTSIGPLCDALHISLSTEGIISRESGNNSVISNGVILELRNFWWKKQLKWKVFCRWLHGLGVTETVLSEESVRQKVNKLQKRHMQLITRHKTVQIRELLNSSFIPPGRSRPDQLQTNGNPPDGEDLLSTRPDILSINVNPGGFPDGEKAQETPIVCNGRAILNTIPDVEEVTNPVNDLSKEGRSGDRVASELNYRKLEEKFNTCKFEVPTCKANLRQAKKNHLRRERRRNSYIHQQRQQTNTLEGNIQRLQIKCKALRLQKVKAVRGKRYYKARGEYLEKEVKKCKTETEIARVRLKEKDEEIAVLVDRIHDILAAKLEVDTMADGKYSNETRQTVMALGSLGLGTKNITRAIDTVASGLFGVHLTKLPSHTTIEHILMEANIVGKMQVCDALLTEKNTTLHADGTTDHQRHFFGYQVTTDTQTYAMAVTETVESGASTQLKELQQTVSEFASLLTTDPAESETLERTMLFSVRNLMSDQHVVNKKFKEDFEDLRLSLLKKSEEAFSSYTEEEQSRAVGLNQWFCFLHVLLGFADATECAVVAYQEILTLNATVPLGRAIDSPDCRRDHSAVFEAIKATCSLLTSSGHPAAGIPEDFRAWMAERNHRIHFIKFAHNRFNVLFHNATALYHHHAHVREFLQEVTQTNQLIEAVKGDLSDDILLACVRGVALMHIIVTAPFHVLVLSPDTKHILDLNPYMKKLRTALEELSCNPWCILRENYTIWEDKLPHKNDVYHSVLPKSDEEEHVDITMEVVSLVATHCLVVFSRQVSSQLPGGEHAKATEELKAESTSVPTSNSIGESHFAYLKYLRHIKPNASVENVEGSVMWAYNKTLGWLQGLSHADRNHIMQTARTKSTEFKELWSERKRTIRKMRLEKLKLEEKQQEDKVAKQVTDRQKTLDEVDQSGGQCHSAEDVERLVAEHSNQKELLSVLKSQLRYYKSIVCPPGVDKCLFLFSRMGKAFSCDQLARNLKAIIAKYQEYLNTTPATPAQPSVAELAARQTKMLENKREVLCNYLTMSDGVTSSLMQERSEEERPFSKSYCWQAHLPSMESR